MKEIKKDKNWENKNRIEWRALWLSVHNSSNQFWCVSDPKQFKRRSVQDELAKENIARWKGKENKNVFNLLYQTDK